MLEEHCKNPQGNSQKVTDKRISKIIDSQFDIKTRTIKRRPKPSTDIN